MVAILINLDAVSSSRDNAIEGSKQKKAVKFIRNTIIVENNLFI